MRWNVAGDMLLNQHKKFAYCVIITASSGLKSAKKEKGYMRQTNCHASSGQSHDEC
jgi:hypothetical protein